MAIVTESHAEFFSVYSFYLTEGRAVILYTLLLIVPRPLRGGGGGKAGPLRINEFFLKLVKIFRKNVATKLEGGGGVRP